MSVKTWEGSILRFWIAVMLVHASFTIIEYIHFNRCRLPFAFLSYVKEELPCVRIAALCLFDDFIEFCGATAHHQHVQPLLPILMHHSQSDDALISQLSIYGMAKVAECAPEHFAPFIPQVLPLLHNFLDMPNWRESDHSMAVENVVSLVGILCKHHGGKIDRSKLLPLWLSSLPLREDESEAQAMHALLCEFLDKGEEHILGKNGAQIPKCIEVMGEVLAEEDDELVDEKTRAWMVRLVYYTLSQHPKCLPLRHHIG